VIAAAELEAVTALLILRERWRRIILTYSPRADAGDAGCVDASAGRGWPPPDAATPSLLRDAAACAASPPIFSQTGTLPPPTGVATTTVVIVT